MKQTILLVLAFLAFSCTENTTENASQETVGLITQEPTPPIADSTTTVVTEPVPPTATLPYAETKHIFSHPTEPDIFKLELKGADLLSSSAFFTITNPQGKIIYRDSMSVGDLEASMVYEMETPIATADERVKFIHKRVSNFFDEKNFSTPAVAPGATFDQTFGDQITWQTIKNDKNAVGFNYLIGKENGRRIAYSKLNNKVMVVGYFGG